MLCRKNHDFAPEWNLHPVLCVKQNAFDVASCESECVGMMVYLSIDKRGSMYVPNGS